MTAKVIELRQPPKPELESEALPGAVVIVVNVGDEPQEIILPVSEARKFWLGLDDSIAIADWMEKQGE